MKLTINTPRDIVFEALNAKAAIQREAIEINEKRKERYQKELPLPELDCHEMLQMVKEFARKEFIKRKELNNPLQGSIEIWETEAAKCLGEELLQHAKRSENDSLLQEVWKLWPEHYPGPDLAPEQIKELAELQERADEIMEILLETIINALDELQNVTKDEAAITKDTSAANWRFIFNQADWYRRMLRDIIQGHWFSNTGIIKYRTVEIIEREWTSSRPRRWGK